MHEEIRQRLRARLRAEAIDAYVAVTPANLHYCSGFQSAFVELSWQMTGTDMALVPAAEDAAPVLVVSDYCAPEARAKSDIAEIRSYSLWTECRDLAEVGDAAREARLDRPEQYDPDGIFALLRAALLERGSLPKRLGCDLASMKHSTHETLRRTFPDCELVDCEALLYDLRRVKQPEEIARLRDAAALFDAGVAAAAETIAVGSRLADIRMAFEQGAATAASKLPDRRVLQSSFFFPHLGRGLAETAAQGDIVKLDCGVKLDGYWSDGCRTFCLGPPSPAQRHVYDALMAGFDAALAVIRPGATMREIFGAAVDAVRRAGLPNYSRGHVGHSIGMDDQTEEPPFLGPNDARLEPGMVICLELPYYPSDVGGFNIEDMLLITDEGYESLTSLSRELVVL